MGLSPLDWANYLRQLAGRVDMKGKAGGAVNVVVGDARTLRDCADEIERLADRVKAHEIYSPMYEYAASKAEGDRIREIVKDEVRSQVYVTHMHPQAQYLDDLITALTTRVQALEAYTTSGLIVETPVAADIRRALHEIDIASEKRLNSLEGWRNELGRLLGELAAEGS